MNNRIIGSKLVSFLLFLNKSHAIIGHYVVILTLRIYKELLVYSTQNKIQHKGLSVDTV